MWHKSNFLTTIAICLCLGMIIGSVWWGINYAKTGSTKDINVVSGATVSSQIYEKITPRALTPAPVPTGRVELPIGDSPSMGSTDAPITLVEYIDWECPQCGEFDTKYFDLLKAEYIDTRLVRYIVKDYPLNSDSAELAAYVGYCVFTIVGNEKYFEYQKAVYAEQTKWRYKIDPFEALSGYAINVGVDKSTLTTCVNAPTTRENIDADVTEALANGVEGTPTFFLNGRFLAGLAPTYELFKAEVDKELQVLGRL